MLLSEEEGTQLRCSCLFLVSSQHFVLGAGTGTGGSHEEAAPAGRSWGCSGQQPHDVLQLKSCATSPTKRHASLWLSTPFQTQRKPKHGVSLR